MKFAFSMHALNARVLLAHAAVGLLLGAESGELMSALEAHALDLLEQLTRGLDVIALGRMRVVEQHYITYVNKC